MSGPEAIRRCLTRGNRIGEPSAVLFRRHDAARGFDTSYRQLVDLEMWFHLLQRGGFAFVPEPLCQFRFHAGSESARNVAELAFVPELRRLVEKYAPAPDLALSHGWRLHFAYEIWKLQLAQLPRVTAHREMASLYPLALFYLLLPYKLGLEVGDMLHARRTIRRLSRGPIAAPHPGGGAARA